MTEKSVKEDRWTQFTKELNREWRQLGRSLANGWANARLSLRNGWRRLNKAQLDYIVLPVGGSFPERSGPPRGFIERRLPLPPDPLSLELLNARLLAVANADNVRGVVFIFREFSAGLATLQNFRAAIGRLRASGKEAIVYTPYLDLPHYYAASAADLIVAPPGAKFEVLGLFTEVTFLKDALARLGLQADVVQISPYKTAYDRLSQSDLTPEAREQLEWLLDDQFDMLTADMAAGRGLDQADIRRFIDQAPFSVEEAQAAGLIDHVGFDDELAVILGQRIDAISDRKPNPTPEPDAAGVSTQGIDVDTTIRPEAKPETKKELRRARLRSWREGRGLLTEKAHHRTRRYVGVVSLEGLINMGSSRKPPVDLPIPLIGGEMAGEQTLVSLLRKAEKLEDMAALILHVDSGGGSALASDLIGRQIEQLGARKPVVVYMGNMAASGGYYVAAPGQHIMCQPGTLTGSIGVIMAKISTAGLYDRLSLNRVSLERGRHAGLYRDMEPMTAEERALFRRVIDETYEDFLEVVARGRKLPREQVEALGGGRVWTGRQALGHGLVDSHGDFLEAIKKAAELAALPHDDPRAITVRNLFPAGSGYVLPAPLSAQLMEAAAGLLLDPQLRELSGRPLMLLPYDLRFG